MAVTLTAADRVRVERALLDARRLVTEQQTGFVWKRNDGLYGGFAESAHGALVVIRDTHTDGIEVGWCNRTVLLASGGQLHRYEPGLWEARLRRLCEERAA